MLAEEWDLIKLVFETALTLPERERPAYVVSACGGDPQLVAVVNELLRNHEIAGRFLETITVRIHHVFSENELVASRFRIVRLIGDGGMGQVYEAFDERLRVRVALKTLRPELTSDPQALERFRREILIAREVSHENVCKVFDLVEHTDPSGHTVAPCLTMQLIEGESLLKYLQAHRPLSPDEALPVIRQIAAAIDALHAHGIIHRDLKPSNIVLASRNGAVHAVVTDFGLAKPAILEAGLFESQLDFQAGAPYFMAPELLRGSRPSPASDIYALGMIIDEMVTDSRAFPADSLHSLYYQKLWEAPIPPAERSNSLPAAWAQVILRCLDSEPAQRYRRAGDAVSDLEQPETGPVPALVPALPAVDLKASAPSPGRRFWRLPRIGRRARIALGAMVLVVAAVVAAAKSLSEPLRASVVVFPIENLTNRSELNYLSKGIGAELMRRLMLIDGVQVIPYYEPRANMRLNQLKGRFSLEGLLQVSGNRVRLNAQLTENRDGALVWSQDFERDIENPLQLQSDLAEGSVQALGMRTMLGRSLGVSNAALLLPGPLLKFLGFQRTAVPRAATASSAAFDYYLRGNALFEERTVPAALDAVRSYQNALREDPGFALAKAALADTQLVLMDYDYEPLATLVARAREYAEDAIRLNPNLAEGYTSLAAVQQATWDIAGAGDSYKTAIRLNPHFARAHRWYSGLLMQFARYDESLEEMRQSIELDPYDYPAQSNKALFLCYAGRYREAAAQFEETLSHKDLIMLHLGLGGAYFQLALASSEPDRQSYFAKAIRQADLVENAVSRAATQSPSPSGAVSIRYADRMHAQYYTASGQAEAARPYLERLRADTTAGRISPFELSEVYASTGHPEEAMPLLEKAVNHNTRQLMFLKVIPEFSSLRSNPRFQALLKRMGTS